MDWPIMRSREALLSYERSLRPRKLLFRDRLRFPRKPPVRQKKRRPSLGSSSSEFDNEGGAKRLPAQFESQLQLSRIERLSPVNTTAARARSMGSVPTIREAWETVVSESPLNCTRYCTGTP